MGVAEIVVFGVCWLLVASLMLWGVFTERRRGPLPPHAWTPTYQRAAPTDWIVVDTCDGGTPEVAVQAKLIAAALLASRGIDIEALPAADIRTEVTSSDDGTSTTRVLVRAGAMHASRRRR